MPILWRRNELPNKTLDVLISTVVEQTKDKDDTADCLHITFCETALASGMSQNVSPTTPARNEKRS